MENERRTNRCCPTKDCEGMLYIDITPQDNFVRCIKCGLKIDSQRFDDRLLKTLEQLKQDWG